MMRDVVPVLEARGIGKTYGSITAVADVDLQIYPGEVVALVGDNGAGKSTMVKILSGVTAATSGSVLVGGEELDLRTPEVARDAGIETVYQDLALALNLSIAANIFMGREIKRTGILGALGVLNHSRMDAEAAAEVDRLHIRVPSARHKCGELSGGQRQAVAVARAVTWGSKLIIMDEPTAALGVEEQHQVGEMITELKNRGLSVLLISHNIPQVHEKCDRVLVMFQGRLIANLITAEVSIEDIVMWITGAALHGKGSSNR